jgi:hypothetical protein
MEYDTDSLFEEGDEIEVEKLSGEMAVGYAVDMEDGGCIVYFPEEYCEEFFKEVEDEYIPD